MEGIGIDNILGAEEVNALFGSTVEEPQDTGAEEETQKDNHTEETAETDFSDLLGNQSESVGSGETEDGGETPASKNDSGSPDKNLFFSIAKALRDEGVFPDLSDDDLKNVKDASKFRELFDNQVSGSLSARQQRIEEALNGGATPEDIQAYNNDLAIAEFLDAKDIMEKLESEGDEGETLRKQMMYQDYINRGFNPERAKKLINQSIADGNDIEDAKEAFNSCKEFYRNRIDGYRKSVQDRQKAYKEAEQKEFDNLKKQIVDTENFFGGVKVDKNTRQKAYDMLTKPVYKDENGNFLTALQKYQREKPQEFMVNMALMCAVTDNFSNVEKLTHSRVKAGLKKGFEELENVLNNTRRNSDGSLNLANGEPDAGDRENWELAI